MDPNGSGDHHEVQAAASRAVGGGPPLSARAAVSARASSLPPPAPSATDAAVRTTATDSEDPTLPPASAVAATAFGIENPSSDDEESLTPAQIDTIAAAHEEMEVTIQKSLEQTQSEDAPLPPSQIAALANKERGDDETDGEKTAALSTEADEGSPQRLAATSPPQVQGEAITTLIPSADPPASPLPSTDHGQSLQSRQQQIPIRPPPQTMLQPRDGDTGTPSVPVSARPREPSVSVLDATLFEVPPEAIVVPDLPIYDAVPVGEQTFLRKNKKYLIGAGIGSLIGAAVAAGVAVTSNNGSSGNKTIDPKGVVLSTARPSESSSPSGIPSLYPTHSANPSQSPSRSLRPSLSPSTSASPTPFCFGGEINILTDSYPEETSWRISRIDNVDGIANSKVVLEGSPEKESHRTSDEVCLERGDYEFTIFDSCGDGISYPGYYNVAFDGVVIAQGGDFESEDKVSFSVPLPSSQPSESSSPTELPSASFQPSESIVPSQSLTPSFRPSNSFSPSTYWSTLNWNRRGGFNGDASDDGFGRAMAFSADALTMAVGAPPGYVKVYGREAEESGWEQRGNTIRGEAKGDNFGRSLVLSEDGTTLSIGAPGHDSVGPDSGQVQVYEWDEATLSYMQIGDTLYGTASGDEFGWSLDITSGKILAVAAYASDANGIYSGQVTIYAWDEVSSNFQQRGEVINGDSAYDRFGYSVALAEYGQKLAVGAPNNDSNGREAGQVRVFEWDDAASDYKQLGDSLLGDAAGDEFGRSVSFSRDGTTLAVGAPRNSENGQWSGQVKVFAWDKATSVFVQIGQSLYGTAAYDHFGHSVALSSAGKTLAIGADQPVADKPGYVEVYGWDEVASEYKQLGRSLGGEASGDQFGYALALAGKGADLAVGAPRNDRNGTSSGRVEVFNMEL